jgi:NAD(P)H-flavin reductase
VERFLIYCARTSQELVLLQEAKPFTTGCFTALSRPGDGAPPVHVIDVLRSKATEWKSFVKEKKGVVFSCGPRGFLSSVRQGLKEIVFENDECLGRAEREEEIIFDEWIASIA